MTSSSQPTTVSFSHYCSVLKDKAIVDEAEKLLKDFKPVTYDVGEHIKVSTAKETEEKIDMELRDLQAMLANNEEAHPFQNFTVLDTGKAHPHIIETANGVFSATRRSSAISTSCNCYTHLDILTRETLLLNICMTACVFDGFNFNERPSGGSTLPGTLTIHSSECPPYPTQICRRSGWTSFLPLFRAAITSSTYLPSQYPLDDPVPEGFGMQGFNTEVVSQSF
ncbi:hypothetical protein EV368DRAFT_70075 [Lentinula lateritia]|nr:hypothetical protein EV368DRAFT_70075 [Lentinula lateritia]